MKQRISATIDEEILLKVAEKLRGKQFRNKSHLIEYALYKLIGEQ